MYLQYQRRNKNNFFQSGRVSESVNFSISLASLSRHCISYHTNCPTFNIKSKFRNVKSGFRGDCVLFAKSTNFEIIASVSLSYSSIISLFLINSSEDGLFASVVDDKEEDEEEVSILENFKKMGGRWWMVIYFIFYGTLKILFIFIVLKNINFF